MLKLTVGALALAICASALPAPTALACITKRWTEHFVVDPDAKTSIGKEPRVSTDKAGSKIDSRECWLLQASATAITIGCVSTFATKGKPVRIGDRYTIDRTTGRGDFRSTAASDEKIQCIPDRKLF